MIIMVYLNQEKLGHLCLETIVMELYQIYKTKKYLEPVQLLYRGALLIYSRFISMTPNYFRVATQKKSVLILQGRLNGRKKRN